MTSFAALFLFWSSADCLAPSVKALSPHSSFVVWGARAVHSVQHGSTSATLNRLFASSSVREKWNRELAMRDDDDHCDDTLMSHDQNTSIGQTYERDKQATLQWRECRSLDEIVLRLCDYRMGVATLSPRAATVALKRLTQLFRETDKNASHSDNANHGIGERVRMEALPRLLEPIVQSLTGDHSEGLSLHPPLDIVSTVDCLVSLSVLLTWYRYKKESSNLIEILAPVQLLLWGLLEDWNADATTNSTVVVDTQNKTAVSMPFSIPVQPLQLPPQRLTMCLRAVQSYPDATSSRLYQEMMERLCQGDALARLDAVDLVAILHFCTLEQRRNSPSSIATNELLVDVRPSDATVSTVLPQLIVATSRRLRKRQVRETSSISTLVHAMMRGKQLVQYHYPKLASVDFGYQIDEGADHGMLRRELQVMLYTLTKQVVSTLYNDTLATVDDMVHRLSPTQAACVCETMWSLLSLNGTDPLVKRFCQVILPQQIKSWHASSSVYDVTRILSALEHWRMHEHTASVVYSLGLCFQAHCKSIVVGGNVHLAVMTPRDVNTILRCAALLLKNTETAMTPYVFGAKNLLASPGFLSRCGPTELANFAWFTAFKAQGQLHSSDAVVTTLGRRILECDVAECCSPKQACRILNAFTSLCTTDVASAEIEDSDRGRLLTDLFACLGEHLLSLHLSPLDASSAVYAYAKSSYVMDMGIFDHLVGIIASQTSECSIRQVAQTLWACGKMIAFESSSIIDEDKGDIQPLQHLPPYVGSAAQLVAHLSRHVDELSSKDVAQALWAMSRLDFDDADLWEPLLRRVHEVAPNLTTHERANILWSLRTMPITDSKVIFVLTRPFASDQIESVKPQEASNILYALGQLNIRDDSVFRSLTNVMLDQIDSTSAQSVANVLWAHRAVHIEPPQKLLESWASRRLPGLVFATGSNDDFPLY